MVAELEMTRTPETGFRLHAGASGDQREGEPAARQALGADPEARAVPDGDRGADPDRGADAHPNCGSHAGSHTHDDPRTNA